MRQMVMLRLWCRNSRLRKGEAGATKGKESTGLVADAALEARMAPEAGTAAEDEVEYGTAEAVSGMAGTIILSHRHHTFRRSHTITHTIVISNNTSRRFHSP